MTGKPKMASCEIYGGYKEGILADRSVIFIRALLDSTQYTIAKIDISPIYSFELNLQLLPRFHLIAW